MSKQNKMIVADRIQDRIQAIRGLQVMLDRDLAVLYQIETKVLNQAVKRNVERFPPSFMFQLSDTEFLDWKSQFVTSNADKMGLRRPPYAFTEQGVAMLSAVLKSETAVKVSIEIMQAFVAMRRFMLSNADMFKRVDSLEVRQLQTEIKVDAVLEAIATKDLQPTQGVFFNGQVFDAYKFASDLIRSAKKSIKVIDNYVDDTVLTFLGKRKKGVTVIIYTTNISKQLNLDLQKHNTQYPGVEIKKLTQSHDRFLIIDERCLYHFGASLKDLGKKWFAFSRMDSVATDILARLARVKKQDDSG